MGSCSSQSAALHEHSIATATPESPTLDEQDAWDIALAWRDQLQGCVRLETTTERLASSIIPTFDWVTFAFNGPEYEAEDMGHVKNPHEVAACARAATIAWFALSCCEGYSGTENPRFWRRVMEELLPPKKMPRSPDSDPKRGQLPINGAVRFFDNDKAPFPRIRLVVGGADAAGTTECIFLGSIPYEKKSLETMLKRIVAKLQPFIRPTSWRRRVPVQVDALTASEEKIGALFRDVMRGNEVEPEPASSSSTMSAFSQIQLQSVMVMSHMFAWVERRHLQLPRCIDLIVEGRVWNLVQGHRISRFLLAQPSDVDTADPGVQCCLLVTPGSHEMSTRYLSIVCSALPHIRTIQSVKRETPQSLEKGSSSSLFFDTAWLGYAIFHPDAAQESGLTAMDIKGLTPADIKALTRMSIGNNLLGGNSTAYHEGWVQASTVVWMEPPDSRGSRQPRKLNTIGEASWVSLCIESTDALEFQDWVCVVVPGFGQGWIDKSDIVETRSRPPGKSCLRSLRVYFNGQRRTNDLLAVLGDQLTSLDLRNSSMLSKESVRAIMRLCPSLKILRLCHDGSFWADEELVMELPRLRELEMKVYSVGYRLVLQQLEPACLQHLKMLRVISFDTERNMSATAHQLQCFLTNQRFLQFLHWTNGRDLSAATPTQDPVSYNHEVTRDFMQRLPASSRVFHGPIRLECKRAFLSGIRVRYGRCQLPEDVISLIFQYTACESQREIHIHHDMPRCVRH